MRILNGFFKRFGSEFFAFVFGLSIDVFTLMFESRNSFLLFAEISLHQRHQDTGNLVELFLGSLKL